VVDVGAAGTSVWSALGSAGLEQGVQFDGVDDVGP
jgi:hypothetical protein